VLNRSSLYRRARSLADRMRVRVEGLVGIDKARRRQLAVRKAFDVAPAGDYLEFGVFQGASFATAYWAAHDRFQELSSGAWDHSFADRDSATASIRREWDEQRFFAFDSFEGMPRPSGLDARVETFPEGTYACSEAQFLANVARAGVPRDKVVCVKGFFDDTLTDETARRIGLRRAAVVNIDSDLYESARAALAFVTPFLRDGSVILFDEWFQFHGNPALGEQRAFAEWRAAHPEWIATEFQKQGAFLNSFLLHRK
jgi:hypothetical protein